MNGPPLVRTLVAGFSLVIALLLGAAVLAIRNTTAIRDAADQLAREQVGETRLIEEIQQEQATLDAVFYRLGTGGESVDRVQLLARLDASDRAIEKIVGEGIATPERAAWQEVRQATLAFTGEARRVLTQQEASGFSSAFLLAQHEQVVTLGVQLMAAGHRRALAAQAAIQARSRRLVLQSIGLLGAAILLSFAVAFFTMRLTTRLFRQMEEQSGELSRVSWHLLENQETVARRFSHELHDELGQSLTAMKANLVALKRDGTDAPPRLSDTLGLVEEAIRNVRELSHLLRPTILDDLGLDAALRSLAEQFMQRTGIEVDYRSEFSSRLADEVETHLYRIAQEALTNIARHSHASRVGIELEPQGDALCLCIHDNGQGLPKELGSTGGLGLVGMRARARGAGGELQVRSHPAGGVRIEVRVPLKVVPVEAHERRFTQS